MKIERTTQQVLEALHLSDKNESKFTVLASSVRKSDNFSLEKEKSDKALRSSITWQFGTGLAMNLISFISGIVGQEIVPKDIYYFDRIPTYFSPADITTIVVAALIISLLASIYPAAYAVRINPVDAIRHE